MTAQTNKGSIKDFEIAAKTVYNFFFLKRDEYGVTTTTMKVNKKNVCIMFTLSRNPFL